MSSIIIPADRAANHGGDQFHQGGAKFAETFEIWGGLKAGDAVLDIGCGAGRMAIGIGERFNWSTPLIGFDVIGQDVTVCQETISSRHPNFQFHHVNAWNGHYNPGGVIQPHEVTFPAAANSVDFAFATSVFTHMFRREVAHYIAEVMRVLRPGGVLMTTWFILTDAAYDATRAGTARFNFPQVAEDGVFFEHAKRPEDVIGYRLSDVQALLSGFADVTFHQGAWSRTATTKARHSQDVMVVRKPR